MYDIIFSDYDGTLYGKSRKISEKTKESIRKYIQAGGKFIISTGRIYRSIKPIAVDLGLDGDIITSQGSQIYNIRRDEPVRTNFVDTEKTIEVLTFAKERGCLSQCYADNNIYADKDKAFNLFFTNFFGVHINKTKTLIQEVKNGLIKPNKFEILVDKFAIDALLVELKEKFPEFLFSKSAPIMIEIVDKNATKGKSVEYLLNEYGIAKENALAIGDGNNDIDMLDAVGGKVAVNNAAPRLLDTAEYITQDKNGDGVSEIIELILSGKFKL